MPTKEKKKRGRPKKSRKQSDKHAKHARKAKKTLQKRIQRENKAIKQTPSRPNVRILSCSQSQSQKLERRSQQNAVQSTQTIFEEKAEKKGDQASNFPLFPKEEELDLQKNANQISLKRRKNSQN